MIMLILSCWPILVLEDEKATLSFVGCSLPIYPVHSLTLEFLVYSALEGNSGL